MSRIDKSIINDFAILIGNLEIAVHLDELNGIKEQYEFVLDKMYVWVNNYYLSGSFDCLDYSESLQIHDILEDVKYRILPDKNVGISSLITDDVLIRYEVIVKKINDERSRINGKR